MAVRPAATGGRSGVSGTVKGRARTRCGAIVSTMRARSVADSHATPTSPLARYRSPPWTSFVDHREVPLARSRRSTRATERPAGGGVQCDARTRDPAADDQDVDLVPAREQVEVPGAARAVEVRER